MKSLIRRFAPAVFTCSLLVSLPAQTPPAFVQHAPTVNGTVEGSVRQMLSEFVTLNGSAVITEDLLVPGTPTLRLNGNPIFTGTVAGTGVATPTTHTITLNGGSRLRNLRTRTNAAALPSVAAPPAPTGTRRVALNQAGQSPGDFTTLRNLTLNGNVGSVTVPPGVYGDFTANGGSGFTLGVAGATTPAVYAFQRLTLNGNSSFLVVGPVIVTLANGLAANASLGAPAHPEWLKLQFSSGGLTLNGAVSAYAAVLAPAGTVTINGQCLLAGSVTSDRLTVNAGGTLRLLAPVFPNQPPGVVLTAPSGGASFTAPATVTLVATVSDSDGSVARVEFYQGATKLGEAAGVPYSFTVTGLAAGSYTFRARAVDNAGAATDSAAVAITVGANQAPTVALTVPAAGAIFTAPATVLLSATASDADGSVTRVEFFQGTTSLGATTATPYQFTVSGLAVGGYTFKSRATDNAGATTDSSPVAISVVGANQPPVVTLTAPVSGTLFNAPAVIQLAATASDPDGTISKVEFYQGTAKLGESAVAPFAYTWMGMLPGSYALSARAYDNAGAATATPASLVIVQAPLPYVTDFEAAEGYALGSLAGQGGWEVTGGAALTAADRSAGAWSATLPAATPAATLARTFPAAGQSIVFVDVFVKPVAAADAASGGGLQAEGAKVVLVKTGVRGELHAFDGDGVGGGQWRATGHTVALTAGDQCAAWLRLTVREDFTAKKWDLYGEGKMIAYDLGFTDAAAAEFGRFAIVGAVDAARAVTGLDALFIGFDNPLFTDADKDGLDDAWERANGLDPTRNDRAADKDGDGLSNLAEYRGGTDAADFFNGAIPVVESLNGGEPGPDDDLVMRVRRPDGTPWANAPASFEITVGQRRLSTTRGGPDYALTVEVRTDAQGLARAYLEPL